MKNANRQWAKDTNERLFTNETVVSNRSCINAVTIMPMTKDDKEFVDHIIDFAQAIGPVTAKRMFGGYGIFLNGLMFGLIADSTLYLKIDKELEPEFTAKGLSPFTYSRKGKPFKMSYYQAPEETLEDSNEMTIWATKSYHAAVRSAAKKPKQKKN